MKSTVKIDGELVELGGKIPLFYIQNNEIFVQNCDMNYRLKMLITK